MSHILNLARALSVVLLALAVAIACFAQVF